MSEKNTIAQQFSSEVANSVQEADKAAVFLSTDRFMYKGFNNTDELVVFLLEKVFQDWKNPVFQEIRKHVIKVDDEEPQLIDDEVDQLQIKINYLQDKVDELRAMKNELN